MNQWISQILPPVWSVLTHSADIYVRTVVNNTDEADDPVDSDGMHSFEHFIFQIYVSCSKSWKISEIALIINFTWKKWENAWNTVKSIILKMQPRKSC